MQQTTLATLGLLVTLTFGGAVTAGAAPAPKPALQKFAQIGGATPIGIAVSHTGRVFLSFPRAMDQGPYCVAELVNGKPVAYPSAQMNILSAKPQSSRLVSVQGLTIDKNETLWLLDTGIIKTHPTQLGGPKLVGIDLKTNKVTKLIVFARAIAGPNAYLNDVRVSLETGKAGTAFISDSSEKGPNGIVVVDLATGKATRRLHNQPSVKAEPGFTGTAEGMPVLKRPTVGRRSATRQAWMVSRFRGMAKLSSFVRIKACNCMASAQHRSRTGAFLTLPCMARCMNTARSLARRMGLKRMPPAICMSRTGSITPCIGFDANGKFSTVAQGPKLIWPDSLAVGPDGYLYITATQLNRLPKYHKGKDFTAQAY